MQKIYWRSTSSTLFLKLIFYKSDFYVPIGILKLQPLKIATWHNQLFFFLPFLIYTNTLLTPIYNSLYLQPVVQIKAHQSKRSVKRCIVRVNISLGSYYVFLYFILDAVFQYNFLLWPRSLPREKWWESWKTSWFTGLKAEILVWCLFLM